MIEKATNSELKDRIKQAGELIKEAGAEAVYLFGSVATQTQLRPHSDIDLAVSGLQPDRFFRAMGQATDILRCRLDLVDLDIDTPFTRYLKQKGDLQRVA